jgi:hypothetical protein
VSIAPARSSAAHFEPKIGGLACDVFHRGLSATIYSY